MKTKMGEKYAVRIAFVAIVLGLPVKFVYRQHTSSSLTSFLKYFHDYNFKDKVLNSCIIPGQRSLPLLF